MRQLVAEKLCAHDILAAKNRGNSLLQMDGDDAELVDHPTRIGVYGASGTGKTQWTLKLLGDPRYKVDRIVWVCPAYSAKQSELQELARKGRIGRKKDGKTFLLIPAEPGWEKLLEEAIAAAEDEKGRPVGRQTIVLDDLIGKTGGSEGRVFSELFTGGRHRNLSIIELLQRIFPNGEARTHRLNCPIHVVFALGARDEAARLFRQAAPKDSRALSAAYEDIVAKDPHGWVMVDQRHHKKWPELCYRTGDLETCLVLPGANES